jgi:transposase
MVVSRVIDPCSKLATCRALTDETKFSTLGEALNLGEVDEDEFYEAMDWLVARQGWIEKKLAKRHLTEGSLILYDLTSTYYTGNHCPLAKFGHNRDGKKRFPQILLGLLCNDEGCPVAIEVFEGNVADPKTLGAQIKKTRERFGLERIVVVGDRGMITQARLREELSPMEGVDWISALRAPAIRALVQQGAIQLSLFDQRDLAEIISPEYPGERLIACRNPLLAEERARKREDLLQATEKELDKIVAATQRDKRRLKGKGRIGLRVGKVLNRYKVGKHFKLKITEEGLWYERATEKIAAEAALDGVYVIRTSVPAETLKAEETVRAYKGLSAVERAFRSLKTVDLKIRPIHHRLADRVRAHALLCMLAYYVEWHMRHSLAPILFDEEEQEEAEALRDSVVCPAKRSPKAQRKAQRKRTDDGDPVHSFQSLLKYLSTIVKNRVRSRTLPGSNSGRTPEFDTLTTPTPLQRRAFDLLGIPLAM